jgi:hypothetical protein
MPQVDQHPEVEEWGIRLVVAQGKTEMQNVFHYGTKYHYAGLAQLVEHNVANVEVESSNLLSRSTIHGDIMNDNVETVEQEQPVKQQSEWAQRYHAEKLMKRVKKKVRKQLKTQGYSNAEASVSIKEAIKRIASNKPARKAAGRGG